MPRLIIGHTTDTSIKIWVRASKRWPVAFIDVLDSARRKTAITKRLETYDEDFYTCVHTWTGLAPSSKYKVKVAFGKTQEADEDERIRRTYCEGWVETFAPPASQEPFTFMFGSCNLHSLGIFQRPDRAWTQISRLAKRNEARFMIHCGDQIYADIPAFPYASYSHYRDKYLDAWDDCKPARRVLTELPHYMILDDHEIVNNFDRDMEARNFDPDALARVAMKVYWEFQHSHNPDTPSVPYRYHYKFSYGAVQFFVMDTRYYRESEEGQMIDPVQMGEFLEWLSAHRDALKFVVTSVPFVGQVKNPKADKWCDATYDSQRRRILSHVLDSEVEKLIFLTGDMHVAYHATMEVSDDDGRQAVIHELMSSPINQITPNEVVGKRFVPTHTVDLDPTEDQSSIRWTSRIHRGSFYGNHSNVMAVEVVDSETVRYRIYRTSKKDNSPKKFSSITF